jgi:hypothetical protein
MRWSTAPSVEDNPSVLVRRRRPIATPGSRAAQRRRRARDRLCGRAQRAVGPAYQAGQALMTVIPLNACGSMRISRKCSCATCASASRPRCAATSTADPSSSTAMSGHVRRHRRGVLAAACTKRLGQLDQGRAARAGAHSDRRQGSRAKSAARRIVDDGDGGHDEPRDGPVLAQDAATAGGRHPGLYAGSRKGQRRSRRRRSPQSRRDN